jgi:hypothetical protein
MGDEMNRPYRILRFKKDVTPISIGYATKEARDKKAQFYADKDGWIVGVEEWMKPDEWNDWGWWLTGEVAPSYCTHANKKTRVATFPAGPTRAIHTCEDCGANTSEVLE